jgi:hypothetical protein
LKARQSSLGESITILSLTPKINFQQDEKEKKNSRDAPSRSGRKKIKK